MSTLRRFLLLAAIAAGGCAHGVDDGNLEDGDPNALTWISPLGGMELVVGDPVQLTVSTLNPQASVVHFLVDGTEIDACNAADDCHSGGIWQSTTMFATTGTHELTASFTVANGTSVTTVRYIGVSDGSSDPGAGTPGSGSEVDPGAMCDASMDASCDTVTDPGDLSGDSPGDDAGCDPTDPTCSDAADGPGCDPTDPTCDAVGSTTRSDPPPPSLLCTRGWLDPSHGFHGLFGGREWAVRGQRVVFHSGGIEGSVAQVTRCVARYGESIARYADLAQVSRASVVALAIAETGCTNAVPNTTSTRSGIFRLPAATCAALNHGTRRVDCLRQMYDTPDFAVATAVRYLATRTQRAIHHDDPPRMVAAYEMGALRRSRANRWHIATPHGLIDRYVAAYNAYRTWSRTAAATTDCSTAAP